MTANPSSAAQAPRRILVVDDNKVATDLLVVLLKELGHEAVGTYDGFGAISVAETFRPDIVLLDILMPGMDGFEVARCLRAVVDSSCKIVALTAIAFAVTQEQVVAAGFEAVLAKPATAEVLERLLISLDALEVRLSPQP